MERWCLVFVPTSRVLPVCLCVHTPCRRRLPDFTISYSPDFRDAIAKTWPASIDDSAARKQWHWQPKYGEWHCVSCIIHHLMVRWCLGRCAGCGWSPHDASACNTVYLLVVCPADLQAMTDDMLVKLAPKFGVQLPRELQQLVEQQQQQQQSESSSSSSGSRSRGRASVVFPGDFKMAPAESV